MATRRGKSPGLGLVVGLGIGILLALIFKKVALAVLAGLGIAYLLYRNDKS